MMNRTIKPTLAAFLWLLCACGDDDKDTTSGARSADAGSDERKKPDAASSPDAATAGHSDASTSGATATEYKTSSRNLVQWKRAAAIESDLAQALELDRAELCNELGDKNCIRDVHLVPLGGNEPYVSGLMKPSIEPLATTSSVIDRVLLSACSRRAELDADGEATVFKELDFEKPLPAADDDAVKDTVVELYHRLLAREPLPDEVKVVASLADKPDADDEEPLSAQEFAALACFTIGSTTEFLFF